MYSKEHFWAAFISIAADDYSALEAMWNFGNLWGSLFSYGMKIEFLINHLIFYKKRISLMKFLLVFY